MPRHQSKIISYIGKDVKIGRNVKIWHFSYIGDRTVIGDNVKIGSLAHIDYDVKIGSGTKIEGLAYVPPLSTIGKNVFVGPAAVLTNDPYPQSKRLAGVTVEDDVVIGAGALIKSGVKLGKGCVVAMGAVVTKDVPPGIVVLGIPAKQVYTKRKYDALRSRWERGD